MCQGCTNLPSLSNNPRKTNWSCRLCNGRHVRYRNKLLAIKVAEGKSKFTCHPCMKIFELSDDTSKKDMFHMTCHEQIPPQFKVLGYSKLQLQTLMHDDESRARPFRNSESVWAQRAGNVVRHLQQNEVEFVGDAPYRTDGVHPFLKDIVRDRAYHYDNVLTSPDEKFFSMAEGCMHG